jgi:hypothetical protein
MSDFCLSLPPMSEPSLPILPLAPLSPQPQGLYPSNYVVLHYSLDFQKFGGDIVTKKGNRLSTSNTRRLLCLRDWGVLEEGEGEGDSDIEIDSDEEDCCEYLASFNSIHNTPY